MIRIRAGHETRNMLQRAGVMAAIDADAVYPTLKSAMNAFTAQADSRNGTVSSPANGPADNSKGESDGRRNGSTHCN